MPCLGSPRASTHLSLPLGANEPAPSAHLVTTCPFLLSSPKSRASERPGPHVLATKAQTPHSNLRGSFADRRWLEGFVESSQNQSSNVVTYHVFLPFPPNPPPVSTISSSRFHHLTTMLPSTEPAAEPTPLAALRGDTVVEPVSDERLRNKLTTDSSRDSRTCSSG